ncbi:unnamed protein product [Heterobilharzia americana]|nr:unnamed protein product [Heterobilharzia americana]
MKENTPLYDKQRVHQSSRRQQLVEKMRKFTVARYYPNPENLNGSDESLTLDESNDDDEVSQYSTNIIDKELNFPLDPLPKGIRRKQAEILESKKIFGFGVKSPRFSKSLNNMTVTPAPGTYEKYQVYNTNSKLPKCMQPFSKAPLVNRQCGGTVVNIGPGGYDCDKFYKKSTVVKSKGRFDTSNEARCQPIKVGYMIKLMNAQNGPRQTNVKSSIDELLSSKYANRGKISKTERITVEVNSQHELSPNSYNPVDPNMHKSEFGVKSVPFLCKTPRMTRKEYNNFIRNVTPFTGPGRYHLAKYDTSEVKKPECHFYFSKCPRNMTLSEDIKSHTY